MSQLGFDELGSNDSALAALVPTAFVSGASGDVSLPDGTPSVVPAMVLQLLIVLLTFSMSCAGGWMFTRYYFAGMKATSADGGSEATARLLFCAVFGVCCNTLVLVIFELLAILSDGFRLWALRTHVVLLVLAMLFVIPCYYSSALFRTYLPPRAALAATMLTQLVAVYCVLRIAPQWPGVPAFAADGVFSLRVAVLRTGVLGVCFMALLSGFGTVEFPYSVLRAFVVPVNAFEIHALQSQLSQIRDQVESKQRRLAMLEDLQKQARASGASEDQSWVGAMMSVLAPTNQEEAQARQLAEEARALVTMEATLASDLADLQAEKAREMAAATPLGWCLNVLGYVLASYCVFKMFACLKSVVFGDDFTTDPVSRLLRLLLHFASGGNIQLNLKASSQYITLAFVGFISFNSLRAFLKHMRRFYSSVASLFSSPASAASSTLVASRLMLILGGLLSAYTISTLMLLRAQLPVANRVIVTRALGFDAADATAVEFDAIHRWFNGIQLVSLLSSLMLFYWQFSSKKANVMDMPVFSSDGGAGFMV